MQILKEEVRKKIYDAALKEFKNNNYKEASMRNIAKNANMTVGNLYRYFKNKEDLLKSIVKGVSYDIHELINMKNEEFRNFEPEEFTKAITNKIVELFIKYRDELIILITNSKGSIFENYKEEVIKKLEIVNNNVCADREVQSGNVNKQKYKNFISRIYSITFINGVIEIFQEFDNKEEMEYMIYKLAKYCFVSEAF